MIGNLIHNKFIYLIRGDSVKRQIRSDITTKRDKMDKHTIDEKSRKIKERLFSIPEFVNSCTVLFYVSFKSEVNTWNMIEECKKSGKKIVIPVVIPETRNLLLSRITSFDELTPSNYGILEPKAEFIRPVSIEEINTIIVPGVAFDEQGYRIGYGGGYYDRLLQNLPYGCSTIGLAFEMQMINSVPREAHDVRVDMIVTEERIINLRGKINEGA
jgi:5,10-methenyltetrahydrofolate synthetase